MDRLNTHISNDLAKKLSYQQQLSNQVCEALSLDPSKQPLWALKSMRQLTLVTHHSILATQMRFEQKNIQQYLAKHHNIHIDTIKIKLTPAPVFKDKIAPRKRMVVSHQSAAILTQVAASITDPAIKKSMLNIAKLANQSPL